MRTCNRVELKGFVGQFVKLPTRRGDPARFDIMTSERLTTTDGEVIPTHDWHTIQTQKLQFVKDEITQGVLVHITGRITTRKAKGTKIVEIVAHTIEIIDD
jgi:hypothetical protein